MTTPLKIAIAAVIVAALAAVVGYDLMYGKPKPETTGDGAPRNESGLTLLPDTTPRSSPTDLITEAEAREAGVLSVPPGSTDTERTAPPAYVPPVNPDPVPSTEEYVVQAGETLAEIAERKYGDQNKWTLIAKANRNVNPSRMRVGTRLVLPNPAATVVAETPAAEMTTPPVAAETAPKSYTIQAGDVLSKIAKRFYGTASAATRIVQANPDVLKDPDFLTVGATIMLPETPARSVVATPGEPGTVHTTAAVDPAVSTGRTHTVARGDSLWKIAENHHGGLGVLAYMDKLVAANPDKLASKNTSLRAGWVLALPGVE